MFAIIYLLGTFIADLLKSRRRLEVENLFLRHQLNIILRRPPQRLRQSTARKGQGWRKPSSGRRRRDLEIDYPISIAHNSM
jgi:hypothetical protein